MSKFNWKYPWKMWTEELKPTNDIDQAHYLCIEDKQDYEKFSEFFDVEFNGDYFYGTCYGIYRAGMWIWNDDAQIYMSVSDCEEVLGDFNVFDAYVDDEAWEED